MADVANTVDMVNLGKFPPGRLVYALEEVREQLTPDDGAGTATAVDAGIVAGNEALALKEKQAKSTSKKRYGKEATALDRKVDKTLSGLAGNLENMQRAYEDGDENEPEPVAAATLLQALFPRGVQAITGLAYVEQHLAVRALLERADAVELQDVWAMFSSEKRLLERARTLNVAYGEALKKDPVGVTADMVRAARSRAQRRLVEAVIAVMAAHLGDEDAAVKRRRHLLKPIATQTEAMRAQRRRAGQVTDIDPTSGEDTDLDTGTNLDTGSDTDSSQKTLE